MTAPFFRIPYYHSYISPALAENLLASAKPVDGVADLAQVGQGGGLESPEALGFLCELYAAVESDLGAVLARRTQDRRFLDERVRACHAYNRDLGRGIVDADYQTALGLEDSDGRVVFGPLRPGFAAPGGKPIAPLPDFLKGPHVTLFGPPDTAKMAINAMNAFHRRMPGEPAVVAELLSDLEKASPGLGPKWGADDEDSKTPLRADLVDAGVNLTACFEGTLRLHEGDKTYALADDHLALPIKRFPGLALPSSFLFYRRNPIPLHLYDFALHLFRNWNDPRALVFYVPKLENEEEATYLHGMIARAEEMIRKLHPTYAPGTVRLMIVLENPRAILRAHEIIDALHPYFAGASLGWHDYLASTARLFKEDANYRIPVKADPEIVIKYIQASHLLVADVVGSRGGIQVGGMYGILPLAGNAESLQITLRGFFKDVITQLKRRLTGFWVAHPDFVRLGLAIVEAWRQREAGTPAKLTALVEALLEPRHAKTILDFIERADTAGLDRESPGFVRSLIVADIAESDFIANNHPDEIRYNVFQSLQYLTDWLCGNGCVALPTVIDGVPVRVMDDLATAERSRWEVWHELKHGRFSLEHFIQIAHEEMNFIRRDLSDAKKIVQVKWDERTAKWYPVAFRLMLQLMTAREPAEFATELLMPFTVESIRSAEDPWSEARKQDPGKFKLERYVADFDHYFEICGVQRFAREMAARAIEDLELAETIHAGYTLPEIKSAASFHGDIGQSARTLDARAASEQAKAQAADAATLAELRRLGEEYKAKHGFKFLVSAQGKSGAELLEVLKARLSNPLDVEIKNARAALWEISGKRLAKSPRDLKSRVEKLRARHGIASVSIALNFAGETQSLAFGDARPETWFQLASLSKTFGSAFAIETFNSHGILLETPVNSLLERLGLAFRLRSSGDPTWADQVTLAHLMNHSALNMHYVKGIPTDKPMPRPEAFLEGNAEHGYEAIRVIAEPGHDFRYSGAGFILLETIIERLEGRSFPELIRPFLEKLQLRDVSFDHVRHGQVEHARGRFDSGEEVPGGRLQFPGVAAGAAGTALDTARFLLALGQAYRKLEGAGPISHDTSVMMLKGAGGTLGRGCREFMGCDIGLGVFVGEAGANRLAIHQGSNEGFRAIFIHCFDGPDAGKGLVVLCNGDNKAVPLIAEIVRELVAALEIGGIDFTKLDASFSASGIAQEQIVNKGYKALIFDALEPDLPEPIAQRGPLDSLASRNLAVGARIVSVTNQKFARAENLVSPHLPAFDPDLFERQGKVMDSWETERHNPSPSDTLELELKRAAPVRYVSLSTQFHDGNQPSHVRLEALIAGEWRELLPKTPLEGHSLLRIDLGLATEPVSRVRVEIFPDGGLSRLGLFDNLDDASAFKPLSQARSQRFADAIPKSKKPLTIPYTPSAGDVARNLKSAPRIDWASAAFGAQIVSASNEHYSPAKQVISPFPALHMFDGLESARSRKSGNFEEVVIRLGRPTPVARIQLDFTHFVNNNPREIAIDGLRAGQWVTLVEHTRVKAFAGNLREFELHSDGPIEQIRVRTYPDGGINRIRVY